MTPESYKTITESVNSQSIPLKQLHAAANLAFLRVPPQNRLEALKGARKGQWSIRINDQWRLCFEWRDGSALNVEIVDYH